MSRGSAIAIGIVSLVCAIAFLALAIPGSGVPSVGAIVAGTFCTVVILACLVPKTRPVTGRLIGATIFFGCAAYLWSMRHGPFVGSSPGQPSTRKALLAFICFGLPAAIIAIRGIVPRSRRSLRDAKQPRLLTLNLRPVPIDAKVIVEGIAMEQSELFAIHGEVTKQLNAHRASRLRRVIRHSGMAIILVGGILSAPFLPWPFLVAIGAVLGAIAWSVAWQVVGAGRKDSVRRAVMSERGHPICVACGYNLQGSGRDGPCPECGWRRDSP